MKGAGLESTPSKTVIPTSPTAPHTPQPPHATAPRCAPAHADMITATERKQEKMRAAAPAIPAPTAALTTSTRKCRTSSLTRGTYFGALASSKWSSVFASRNLSNIVSSAVLLGEVFPNHLKHVSDVTAQD